MSNQITENDFESLSTEARRGIFSTVEDSSKTGEDITIVFGAVTMIKAL